MAGKHFLLHDTGSLIPRPQYCAHMIFVVSFPGLNLALVKSLYLSFRPKTPSVHSKKGTVILTNRLLFEFQK